MGTTYRALLSVLFVVDFACIGVIARFAVLMSESRCATPTTTIPASTSPQETHSPTPFASPEPSSETAAAPPASCVFRDRVHIGVIASSSILLVVSAAATVFYLQKHCEYIQWPHDGYVQTSFSIGGFTYAPVDPILKGVYRSESY